MPFVSLMAKQHRKIVHKQKRLWKQKNVHACMDLHRVRMGMKTTVIMLNTTTHLYEGTELQFQHAAPERGWRLRRMISAHPYRPTIPIDRTHPLCPPPTTTREAFSSCGGPRGTTIHLMRTKTFARCVSACAAGLCCCCLCRGLSVLQRRTT
jgi:hypothetical protein